jgi:hypothetical protein
MTSSIELKWDYMNLKRFSTTKEMASKLMRLPPEWKKVFAAKRLRRD